MPLLGDPSHTSITSSLRTRVPKLLRLNTPQAPRAIILITAHWSTTHPTISSGSSHRLLYDYYGFPREAYSLKYPAPGSPEVAAEIKDALEKEGLTAELDDERGWDHGVFVPLLLVNPQANVPVVQMSVLESEDSEKHLRMGQALAALRAKNIAIIGSGFASFHNLSIMRRLMMAGPSEKARFGQVAQAWNDALTAATSAPGKEERWTGLKGWRDIPGADTMHPRGGGEHFMPLLVCAGAAGEGEGAKRYADEFVGVEINTYYWGGEEVE